MAVHAFQNNSLLFVCLNNKTLCDLVKTGQDEVWATSSNGGTRIATWFPPPHLLHPPPTFREGRVTFLLFHPQIWYIRGFHAFSASSRHGCILWKYILKEGPFVRKHQLQCYFVSLVSKIVSLLFFGFLDLPDICRLCCKHFPACLSSLVFPSNTGRGAAGAGALSFGGERGSDTGCESCIRTWNDTSSEDNQEALTKHKTRINSDTSFPFPSWAGCHFRDEEIH